MSLKSYIDGLVQERRNSIANALELRLYCTNPSIYVLALLLAHCVLHCNELYHIIMRIGRVNVHAKKIALIRWHLTIFCSVPSRIWHMISYSLSSEHGVCWWLDANLAPGHIQQSRWHRPVILYQEVYNSCKWLEYTEKVSYINYIRMIRVSRI